MKLRRNHNHGHFSHQQQPLVLRTRTKKGYLSGKKPIFGIVLFFLVVASTFYYHLSTKNLAEMKAAHIKSSALDELIHQVQHPSLRILLTLLKSHEPPHAYGEAITDEEAESMRCQRYGFEYGGRKTRRRIFFGSLIADDSWHPIAAHAAEAYGLYHTVALIESNTTTSHRAVPRKLRFPPYSLNLRVLQSGIFGPSTRVSVDLFIEQHPEDRENKHGRSIMGQEHLQRELILQIWKQNGMDIDDIGIVSDLDEVFSRDFLLATQSCDIPQFRPGQNCLEPKIIATTLVFESSPECVTDDRYWSHPDMVIGECIDTIGNSDVHKPGKREFNNGTLGRRIAGYGKEIYDYSLMPNTTQFPLWKPVDFRATKGGSMYSDNEKQTGFHFHNFFESINVLRRKYKTYSHELGNADKIPLGKIHNNVNLAINCVTDRPDFKFHHKGYQYNRVDGGFQAINGSTPLIFQHSEYRVARQQELREMILEDESQFGRYDEEKVEKK